MEKIFLEGFLLQASLIFALGAQNIFIIEQGLTGNHPFLISFICFLCDLILILFGVTGMGFLFLSMPIVKIAIGISGILLMFFYAINRMKTSNISLPQNNDQIKTSTGRLIMLSIIFSWLNPHAYLDAFVLIGGQSVRYADHNERIIFGFGAGVSSLIWFLSLSYLSLFFSLFLKKIMEFLNLCSILIFLFFAIRLSFEVKGWIVSQ